MLRFIALLAMLFASVVSTAAEEPSIGPAIEGYGPTYPIADRDVTWPEGFVFKMAFDIAADPNPGKVNRNLVSVARYLNMHARNGVPVDDMKIAVVVHGKATRNLVKSDDNPNLELLSLLQEAGVQIYVCGQSMTYAGIAKNQLADGVQVGLSAMTMLTILQSDHYALLPWGAQ